VIHANTDAARHEVLDFFLAAFDDIDPNAVPTTVHDDLYARSWCNSAMRTAGGCWVPPHLPRTGRCRCVVMKKRGASLPPEPTRLLRPIPASLNVSTSASHCNFAGRQPNKSQGRTQRICAIHESDRYSATRASR